jgi:hypothetical protein
LKYGGENTVDDKTIHVVIDANPEKVVASTASKAQPPKQVTGGSTSKLVSNAYAPVKSDVIEQNNKPKHVEIEHKETPIAIATINENDDEDELQEETLLEEDEDN